jgi:glycosyltransferase involved in cell wall biosynthesis
MNGRRALRFWVHDPAAPSFRHRLASLEPTLAEAGFDPATDVFPRRRYGLRILERRRTLQRVDLLVIAKLKLLPFECGVVRRSARAIVYDFDDAVYIGKPARPDLPPDRSAFRLRKFAATCRMADLVIAGNAELADVARRYARRVEIVSTSIDAARYPGEIPARRGTTAVWIGLPGNLEYLEAVRPALARLARERSDFRLRVVCSRFPDWPEVPIEAVTWSEQAEISSLVSADVGLMPLPDNDWTRGKGAFKLLQYMAASLPCVASPVGMNREVVEEGVTGHLVSEKGWESVIRSLLDAPEHGRAMGEAGRRKVLALYDRSRIGPRVASLYSSVV